MTKQVEENTNKGKNFKLKKGFKTSKKEYKVGETVTLKGNQIDAFYKLKRI